MKKGAKRRFFLSFVAGIVNVLFSFPFFWAWGRYSEALKIADFTQNRQTQPGAQLNYTSFSY